MLVNFSTLAMFVPAVKDIGRARGVGTAGEIAALTMLIVIVLIPAWLPVALRAAFPDRAKRILKPRGPLDARSPARARRLGLRGLLGLPHPAGRAGAAVTGGTRISSHER